MNTSTLLPLMMAALYYDPAILPAELLNDFNRKCSEPIQEVQDSGAKSWPG